MTSKRYHHGQSIILRTPLARCLTALLSCGLFALPSAVYADSGGQIEGISGDLWYIGSTGRSNNIVSVDTDSTSQYSNAAGGYSDASVNPGSLASNNALTIENGGKVKFYTYGGFADSKAGIARADENTLTLKNGSEVQINAYGGWVNSYGGSAAATGNRLNVESGGKVGSFAYGGFASSFDGTARATDNIVTVEGTVNDDVYGGWAFSNKSTATVSDNKLIIASGGIGQHAFGGRAGSREDTASTTGNSLIIAGAVTFAYGGYTSNLMATASSTDNTLTIGGSATNAYGGYATSNKGTARVSGNILTVENGGIVGLNAYGGRADSPDGIAIASGNKVTVNSGGRIGREVYGGFAESTNGTANASANTVTMVNMHKFQGNAYGGYAYTKKEKAIASGNTLNMGIGETFEGKAYGGYARNSSGTASASSNSLVIENGSKAVISAYGGRADSTDGAATATGNRLTINSGAEIDNAIYGGFAKSTGGTANASGNTINIENVGKLTGNVYGGYSQGKAGAKANSNRIILGSSLTQDTLADVSLFGGYAAADSEDLQQVSGNSLEIRSRGLNVKSIANFDNFKFVLPQGTQNGDTVLKITGGEATTFSQKTGFSVTVASGATISKGSKISLINNEAGLNGIGGSLLKSGNNYNVMLKGTSGISLEYDFELSNDATNIYATLADDPKINPKTKAVLEGCLGGIGVVNSGSDLVAGAGISQAIVSTGKAGATTGISVAPFAAAGGGRQRLETGSHVNVNGVFGLVGVAVRKDFETAGLTCGGFFEFGSANLKTHNSFSTGDVNGKGNSNYRGGGLLARLDLTATALRGLYVESSIRLGRISNDWHTNDIVDAVSGKRAELDLSYHYYGAHLGLGYLLKASDNITFDIYSKVLWSRLNSKETKVADDQYTFDAINSWRTRVGTKVDFTLTKTVSLYTGAAWEHEFDGDARGRVSVTTISYDVPSPSTGGNSAVIDLGVSFNNPIPGLTLGLGATGYLGDRRGVTGNLNFRYAF